MPLRRGIKSSLTQNGYCCKSIVSCTALFNNGTTKGTTLLWNRIETIGTQLASKSHSESLPLFYRQ